MLARPNPALFHRFLAIPALALALAPALPAAAQHDAERLRALGYTLQLDAPDEAAILRLEGRAVWSLPAIYRTVLAFSGPRDMTGNHWPDLMVLTGARRSGREIAVLELGPEPARQVYQASALSGLDANRLMEMPEGAFLDKMIDDLGLPGLDPAHLSPPPVGDYRLEYSEPLSRLIVRLDDVIAWASENTVLGGTPDPMDMTGDGVNNLLVHEALSRSQRRLHLLSLGSEGVSVLWHVSAHAGAILPLLQRLIDGVEAGRSIAEAPELPDRSDAESQTQPQAADTSQAALQRRLESLGFELRHGENRWLELRLGGVVLWRQEGHMMHGHLQPATAPGHLQMVTNHMLSRQRSIETLLELGPYGMRVLSQHGIYHGPPVPGMPQPPEQPRPPAPDATPPETLATPHGYEITLSGSRDRLAVHHEGHEVWALEAAVITYHRLVPGAPPALADLLIQSQDAAGAVTNHRLPLVADGPGEPGSRPLQAGQNGITPEALQQLLDTMRPQRPGGELPADLLEQLQDLRPSR